MQSFFLLNLLCRFSSGSVFAVFVKFFLFPAWVFQWGFRCVAHFTYYKKIKRFVLFGLKSKFNALMIQSDNFTFHPPSECFVLPTIFQSAGAFHQRFKKASLNISILFLTLIFFSNKILAQDPGYTQAYLSPVYLNPAATGTGEYDLRISCIYRRQWWSIPSSMNYMAVSLDKYLERISSGVGLLITHSSEGYLKKTSIYGTYSYTFRQAEESWGSGLPKWLWTGGLQFGATQSRIDYSKLVFADQLTINGIIPGSTSAANPAVNSGIFRPDFAAGTFLTYNFNEDRRMIIGISGHHLNKPDESLSNTTVSQLPLRLTASILFGFLNAQQNWSFNGGGIIYSQAQHKRYQIGFQATNLDYSNITVGLWYGSSAGGIKVNTLSASLSLNLTGNNYDRDKITIGLSHDSQMNSNTYYRTAGSSELGFVWDHSSYENVDNNVHKHKVNSVLCPPVHR